MELPDRFEINEYRMMERFALKMRDVEIQDQLLMALHGSGAFRRFKDAVYRLGLAQKWYQNREEAFEAVARRWCVAHGIPIQESTS